MKHLIIIIILNLSFIFSQEISGTVSDKLTGARLSGVNIVIIDTDKGVSTNSNGEYSLDINGFTASQIVQFKHIGYDERLVRIDSLGISSNIFLQPRVLQFEAIERFDEESFS